MAKVLFPRWREPLFPFPCSRQHREAAAAFYAKLASIADIGSLTTQQGVELLLSYDRLLLRQSTDRRAADVARRVWDHEFGGTSKKGSGSALDIHFQQLLDRLRGDLHPQCGLILEELHGRKRAGAPRAVSLTSPLLEVVTRRFGETSTFALRPKPTVADLLNERPIPFGRCPCGDVFARKPGGGRTRGFCSSACQSKHAPSAKQRPMYM